MIYSHLNTQEKGDLLMLMLILIIVAIVIIGVLLYINLHEPSSHSSPYAPSEVSDEPTVLTGRRPRISADVSEDFYYTVQDYCRENSMTISALIRTAVESYIGSEPASATPTRSTRRSTVIMSDGSWKCPSCGNLNASYVGTCSCGGTRDSAPPKPPRKKNSYIMEDGSWRCPKCHKVNASYVGTCSCGRSKE